MKLLVDFWWFPRICKTWSLNCFCFDLHISAEQFYDRNKQEWGKNRNQQTMPCQMMARYQNDRLVSWRLSCITDRATHDQLSILFNKLPFEPGLPGISKAAGTAGRLCLRRRQFSSAFAAFCCIATKPAIRKVKMRKQFWKLIFLSRSKSTIQQLHSYS